MSGGYNEIGTHEMDPMIERVLLLKQEAFVYKIPPAQVSFHHYVLVLERTVRCSRTVWFFVMFDMFEVRFWAKM